MLHAARRNDRDRPDELIPKRRGLHEMERYQLSTSFPFGFIKRAIDRGRKTDSGLSARWRKVDPKLLAMCRSAESTGSTMRPRRGGIGRVLRGEGIPQRRKPAVDLLAAQCARACWSRGR